MKMKIPTGGRTQERMSDDDIVNAMLSLDHRHRGVAEEEEDDPGTLLLMWRQKQQQQLQQRSRMEDRKAGAPARELLLSRQTAFLKGAGPGSRRHTRWLNRRLLYANLRRIVYESGDDIMELDDYQGFGAQTMSSFGRKGYVGIGSKNIPLRKVPTFWTQLREDVEASQLFRHRREDELLSHQEDYSNESTDESTEEDKDGCPAYPQVKRMMQQQRLLELKIFNTFCRFKRTIVHRALFIVDYLEVLERVFSSYLTEWREQRTLSTSSIAPLLLERNHFKLEHSCSLRRIQPQEQNQREREMRLRYPDALLLWNLSGIHRKMTYLVCSVWGLLCHAQTINNTSSNWDRQSFHDKVVVVQIPLTGIQIPVFPVAMNLVSILTKPAEGTLTIRTSLDSGVFQTVD